MNKIINEKWRWHARGQEFDPPCLHQMKSEYPCGWKTARVFLQLAGETKECVHLTQRKTRCCSTGFFYSVLVEGGLSLRLAALFSLIQPFANVVGDYACHDREKKRKKQVHRTHPLPTTDMGWQPVHYNIKLFFKWYVLTSSR